MGACCVERDLKADIKCTSGCHSDQSEWAKASFDTSVGLFMSFLHFHSGSHCWTVSKDKFILAKAFVSNALTDLRLHHYELGGLGPDAGF